MSDEPSEPAEKLLDRLLKPTMPWREALNLAYIPGIIQQQKDMAHQTRRQNSQVDAMLKAKYAACGQEYEPPSEEDDVGDVYINCPQIGAKALGQLAAMDQQQPPSQPTKKPWWQKLLAALLLLTAVLLGALLIWLTLRWFGGNPDSYEIVAVPYRPSG